MPDAYDSFSDQSSLGYNIATVPTFNANPVPTNVHYETNGAANMPAVIGRSEGFSNNDIVYNSYAGVDIVATMVLPNDEPITMGELQTISYSTHRENMPVRTLGHTAPIGFVKGSRTIGGSMIFTVFNYYAFYRLRQFQVAIENGLYPLSDMLPPFDVVLTFANESGVFSKMKIFGVTFTDEGGTMSVDDLITEQTFSYMARGLQPMTGYYLPEVSSTNRFL